MKRQKRKARKPRTYKPTEAEWGAIRKGEAEIARGEYVGLEELLKSLKNPPRKITKAISEGAGRFITGRYEE